MISWMDVFSGWVLGVAMTSLFFLIKGEPPRPYRPSSEDERDEHEEMANAERMTEYLERTEREGKEQ